jgi:hypothetical protein
MMNELQCNHNISVVFDDLLPVRPVRYSAGRSWFSDGERDVCMGNILILNEIWTQDNIFW